MKVFGIDIAPGKPSTVFDGQTHNQYTGAELSDWLSELSQSSQDVLICLDAPLAGPADPDSPTFLPKDHTQRPIESFFSKGETGIKVPKGVSVLPYSGCPHWTITRRLLGLPRIGRWDVSWKDLPFKLVTEPTIQSSNGQFVVEVHPALATWLWNDGPIQNDLDWEYKKSRNTLLRVWRGVKAKLTLDCRKLSLCELDDISINDDDELDAVVAWLLWSIWVSGQGQVRGLGNIHAGHFLLPFSEELEKRFEQFVQ